MKFELIGISLIAFIFSMYQLIQRKESPVVGAFYFVWFLLFISLFIASDYEDLLSENIINTFAVLFFVWLTLLPPLLFGIINDKLSQHQWSIKHLYIPIVLFLINIFSVLYFSVQKNEKEFTYEVVESVMTYSNFIIILFVFPISTIYYSFLSYRAIKIFPTFESIKNNFERSLLFLFVLLYNIYILIWMLTNYLIVDTTIKAYLKSYYFIYFIISILVLLKISFIKNELDVDVPDNSIFDEIELRLKEKIFQEQVYLNPGLSLNSLAKELGTNEKYLSQFINKTYNKNFSLFLNEYRIEFAKKTLVDIEYSNYTLEAIGALSGFNSKSSFNSTFKKITGETPSEYKNNKGA